MGVQTRNCSRRVSSRLCGPLEDSSQFLQAAMTAPRNPCHRMGEVRKSEYPDIPSTTLTSLPVELIGQIALNVRYHTSDGKWEDANAFLLKSSTTFPSRRKDISALSQTCSFIRGPVERILYQDIHLDFHRWDILPAPAGEDSSDSSDSSDPECDSDWADAWRTSIYPGSLPLLLRTLDQRPDLGIYVRSVLVDWLGEDISASSPRELSMKYGAMIQLFERCPRLQRLVIPTLPPDEVIAKFSCAQMTTLACGYDSSKVPAMVRKCPSLRSLQCVDCKKWNHSPCLLWQGPFPRHNLAALELHGEGNDAAGFVMQALQLCTASVQELTISYSNGWGTIGPEIPRLDPDIGQNLITLRIKGVCASTSKGFCILKDSPRKFGQILRNLPALKHLHLTRHAPLTPESFTLLPRGLRSLTLSCYGLTAYGDRYTRNEYIHALASCLRSPAGRARNVTKIIALGVEEFNSRILGDLQPLRQLCDVEGISFLEEEGDTTYCYSSAIRIIF